MDRSKLPKLPEPVKYEVWGLTRNNRLVFYITLATLGILFAFGAKTYMAEIAIPAWLQQPNLQIAHRGYSSAAPENTVAALKTAHLKHIKVVEIDLMLSKDGEIVVAHDYDLSTFTSHSGAISELEWSKLKDIKVTRGQGVLSRNGYTEEDTKLANFETILSEAKRLGIHLLIELKAVTNTDQLIKKVAKALIHHNYLEKTIVSSFFPTLLMEFQRISSPYIPTLLLLYSHSGFHSFCNHHPESLRTTLLWKFICSSPSTFDMMAQFLVQPIAKIIGAGIVGLDIYNPAIEYQAMRSMDWKLKTVIWTVNSASQRELVSAIEGNQDGRIAVMSDCPMSICAE